MERIKVFLKNETVLLISLLLAMVSAFFVKPSMAYIEYIDFRTLALLFCLMAVMAGCSRLGLFDHMAAILLKNIKTDRGLMLTLVTLCFFSAMLITNDVALITFVPFTVITLGMVKRERLLIYTVTLETVAANLGSMLTPVGNPQNLYLFSAFNMSIGDFFGTIFLYAIVAYLILLVCCFGIKKNRLQMEGTKSRNVVDQKYLWMYTVMFVAAICSVFRLLDCYVLLLAVITAVFIFDRETIFKIDYSLLLTFVFLFIFVGNLGEIDVIRRFLEVTVKGNEVLTGVLASQFLSNVPTAILLSGFTENIPELLIGVNLGGLGTLIASMASLISFKYIQRTKESTARYVLVFTLVNIMFLGILYLLHYIVG